MGRGELAINTKFLSHFICLRFFGVRELEENAAHLLLWAVLNSRLVDTA